MSNIKKINSDNFYGNYHGHKIEHLNDLFDGLNKIKPNGHIVYLAGDSSLDNKYWLLDYGRNKAVNGYEYILEPGLSRPDVCYYMNNLLVKSDYTVINCAIEESTLASRNNNLLLPQDRFIHYNIRDDDILVVSVGGNDIALNPSWNTIWNMGTMMYLNNIDNIRRGPQKANGAWGMKHFINMFKNDVRKYIMKLIGTRRPKKIIVCMIYYPDEKITGSWADKVLGYLGYNKDPQKLQEAIKQIFIHATSKIIIPGSEVIPFPMYKIMNGRDTHDYVQRVEPSHQGGKKLADAFVKIINDA